MKESKTFKRNTLKRSLFSKQTRTTEMQILLSSFYEEKVKGIIIRARARWHEHGEKSTEYFLNLEKRNHIKKHMRKLNINGSITKDPFNVLKEQRSFYQELYTSRNNNNNEAIESFL